MSLTILIENILHLPAGIDLLRVLIGNIKGPARKKLPWIVSIIIFHIDSSCMRNSRKLFLLDDRFYGLEKSYRENDFLPQSAPIECELLVKRRSLSPVLG